MNYEEWEKTVSDAIKADTLWKMTAYRLALFVSDLGWHLVTRIIQLVLKMVPQQHGQVLCEAQTTYQVAANELSDGLFTDETLKNLLNNVPLADPSHSEYPTHDVRRLMFDARKLAERIS